MTNRGVPVLSTKETSTVAVAVVPQYLIYGEGVDGGALYLVGLLARDPACLVLPTPHGGPK